MRILISSGDVSGDVAGGLLTRAIREQRPAARVLGIGGAHMAAAGADVRVHTSHLGVTGVTEIVHKLPGFVRAWSAIRRTVRDEQPAVAVLIGNDLFSVILGRWLRHSGIATISYFPPPTWMWGPLVRLFVESFDVVLTSFPDEHDAYSRAGDRARVQFVGHYLADALSMRSDASRRAARARLGVSAARVVALMPGSRQHEVARLLPVMADSARRMLSRDGTLQFVLPVAAERYRPLVERELARAGIADRVRILNGPNYDCIVAADLVILASGTASLEATLVGTPMIILYKVSTVTAWCARAAIRTGLIAEEVIGLPNLILGRMAVPELTQEHANGVEVAAEAFALLESESRRATMIRDLADAARLVAGRGALASAASVVIELAPDGVRR